MLCPEHEHEWRWEKGDGLVRRILLGKSGMPDDCFVKSASTVTPCEGGLFYRMEVWRSTYPVGSIGELHKESVLLGKQRLGLLAGGVMPQLVLREAQL